MVTQTGQVAGADLRPDWARMRVERRGRLFEAMADEGIDALVLGRPANVQFATGARQLWTAGSRPFGPACLVLAATRRVHLLSNWDEGVPPEIQPEEMFGLTWNPAILLNRLHGIPGLRHVRRVGTDGVTPGTAQLFAQVCPDARLVDGATTLWRARARKSPDELACIQRAAQMAESALSALVPAVVPGVSERSLVGVYLAAIAALGAPTPPTEGVVCATPRRGPVERRRLAGDRPLGPGELVALNPGAFYGGYEGVLARTRVAGAATCGHAGAGPGPGRLAPTEAQSRLAERGRAVLVAVVAACRAGATGAELMAAWAASGEPPAAAPFVRGVGLGAEPPLIGAGLGASARLEAGMVLAVEAWVAEEGAGGVLEQDMVLVTDGDPEVLTRYERGPLA
jgi:Xaa-Pro aminopeptidase